MVDDLQQRLAVVLHGLEQFQRADGEFVQSHILFLLDARQRCDVRDVVVLRHFQILQDDTACHDAILQMLHAEALQALHAKVLEQFLVGSRFGEHPVVQFEGKQFVAEETFKGFTFAPFEEHLLGREIHQQFFHGVKRAFAGEELSRTDVEKGHAARSLAKMHGSEKIVLLVIEHIIRHGHPRSHQFGDAPFHQFLGQLRVFQLVADGHPSPRPDEFGQIGVDGMVGKSCHFGGCRFAAVVVTSGERDA